MLAWFLGVNVGAEGTVLFIGFGHQLSALIDAAHFRKALLIQSLMSLLGGFAVFDGNSFRLLTNYWLKSALFLPLHILFFQFLVSQALGFISFVVDQPFNDLLF